jgi:hypothetical protein
MKCLLSIPLLLLAILLVNIETLHAQQVQGNAIGPKLGLYLDRSYFMLGGIAEFPFTSNINFEPGVEIVFGVPNVNRFVLDGNIRYDFLLQGLTMRPFIMGGIGLQFETSTVGLKSQTNFLLNIGGGAAFNTRSRIQPWGGIKFGFLGGGTSGGALLQGGVNFYL